MFVCEENGRCCIAIPPQIFLKSERSEDVYTKSLGKVGELDLISEGSKAIVVDSEG